MPDPDGPESTISRPGSCVQSASSHSVTSLRRLHGEGRRPPTTRQPLELPQPKINESIPGLIHSTFCTSSRIFSRRPLISTTLRLIATSLALEPIVLTSRPISCTTNSSFRPALTVSSMISWYLASRGLAAGRSLRKYRSDRPGWPPRGSGPGVNRHPLVADQRLHTLGEALLVRLHHDRPRSAIPAS